MSYRRIKDKDAMLATGKVWSICGEHYWHLYLWPDSETLEHEAGISDGDVRQERNSTNRTLACHVPMPEYIEFDEDGEVTHEGLHGKKIGELHFIAGEWNQEITPHEAAHGTLCWYRYVKGDWEGLAEQERFEDTEEAFCYQLGDLSDRTYRWLWEVDPRE